MRGTSQDASSRRKDVIRLREKRRFEDVRLWSNTVFRPHTQDRRIKIIENLLIDGRGDFRGKAAEADALAGDNTAAGLSDRLQNSFNVERYQAAQVNDFRAYAEFPVKLLGGVEGVVHSRPPSDDGDVIPRALDV